MPHSSSRTAQHRAVTAQGRTAQHSAEQSSCNCPLQQQAAAAGAGAQCWHVAAMPRQRCCGGVGGWWVGPVGTCSRRVRQRGVGCRWRWWRQQLWREALCAATACVAAGAFWLMQRQCESLAAGFCGPRVCVCWHVHVDWGPRCHLRLGTSSAGGRGRADSSCFFGWLQRCLQQQVGAGGSSRAAAQAPMRRCRQYEWLAAVCSCSVVWAAAPGSHLKAGQERIELH